jgi:hypothetical protein
MSTDFGTRVYASVDIAVSTLAEESYLWVAASLILLTCFSPRTFIVYSMYI